MAKREVVWDLSEMFPSTTDPLVQQAIDDVNKMAVSLASIYQGKIKDFSAKELLRCIEDYEGYCAKLNRIAIFSGLSFMANMTSPDTQSLNDKVNKMKAKLDWMLAFWKIEVGSLASKSPGLINDPILFNYRHFLERLRREFCHQLSEAEEKLVIQKDQFGIYGWEELQEKWLSTRRFEVEVEGRKKTLSFSEAFGLIYHRDRPTRESAIKSIFSLLGKDSEIFSSALRNICNDWLSVCQSRKYDSPMEASLIANDIDQETINNLLKTVEYHTELYRRYLKLKAKIMKLPKLCGHDVSAPILDTPETKFDYETARDLIIKAYSRFDENYAFAVKDMFTRSYIDASLRLGKKIGGWSYCWYEGKSAFIIMSFNGTLSDIYTLAHELGHATHIYYHTRNQSVLNGGLVLRFPMIVAEIASTFGELLLTDLLLSESKSNQERKAILCGVLDGAYFFRTASWASFEQSLYETIKRGEYLDYKKICKCWVAARDKIDGDAIEYSDEEVAYWTFVPHFYMPNFRFYNYPYTYAQLFVYALYQKYLEEGKEFVPKFKKALSAGCGISPVEIGKMVGLDVTDPHFWELGLKQYEHFLEELEKIVA